MENLLKVHEVQKSLINQQMIPKRQQARKKVIDAESECLFADILLKEINRNKSKYKL